MMTIGLFSERTGLRPKTLRYYEEVDLLVPAVRTANGYRQYEEEQVETALLIHSLRQAGVSIAEIKQFLTMDHSGQEYLLQKWRRDTEAQMLSLQIAAQFLKGFHKHARHLRLVRWDEPKNIVWFPLKLESLPIQKCFDMANFYINRITVAGLTLKQPGTFYVRFRECEAEFLGEIGYEVSNVQRKAAGDFALYKFPPTLFAALECNPDRPAPCKPIFAAIRQSGFDQVDTPMRQYSGGIGERYLLLVPVMLQSNNIKGE